MKKILFLGNSFTYYYNLPELVEEGARGELICHSITRGGAYLNAYKTPTDELRIRLDEMVFNNEYDYVVLQEQSLNAILNFADFESSVKHVKSLVGKAKILIYQTWSYADGSPLLLSTGLTFDEMTDGLENAANRVAKEINADVIPVGRVFYNAIKNGRADLYDADCLHPSRVGTALAANVFLEYFNKL